MPGPDLFLLFTEPLDELGLTYLVSGSVASIIYGEPRLTHDVDIVLDLDVKDANRLVDAFPQEHFYCPPPEVVRLEARRRSRGHFNLIHHESGYKADIYLRDESPLHGWALSRRRPIDLPGGRLWVAPPEYVILSKLLFYREGGANKHLRDICGILDLSADVLDRQALDDWIIRLKLTDEWGEVLTLNER